MTERSDKAARGPAPEPLLYSVEEAARLLGIGRTFTFHLLATGEIGSVKIGKRRKIPRDALDEYVERLRCQQGAASSTGGAGQAAPAPARTRLASVD